MKAAAAGTRAPCHRSARGGEPPAVATTGGGEQGACRGRRRRQSVRLGTGGKRGGDDLVDAFDQACKAGIVIEEPGGRYRFNHAIVRQSLLAELPSVRRMRLHQRIAATLENEPGPDDERLAELAHHYFECAWAGNAAKAVLYCRRAADQAMARLAYEGAADLYDRALHALERSTTSCPTATTKLRRC